MVYGDRLSQTIPLGQFRIYGKNGTMGPLEPVKEIRSHELCSRLRGHRADAGDRELDRRHHAPPGAASADSGMERTHHRGRAVRTIALDRGAVYRFNVNHVVVPDDPYEMFPMELVRHRGDAHSEGSCRMTTLAELARLIRSKNAGPFELTFDIMFDDAATYERVKRSGAVRDDLAWTEQFPGRGYVSAIGEPFEAQVGIAAPREMDAPDVAVLFAEAVFTRPDERRVLVRRAPCPVLHVDRTAQERLAVRVQLAAPAPVERDDVDGVGGKGDRELEVAERVRRVTDVGDGGSHAQQPAGFELDAGFEFQPGDFVPSDDRDVARVGRR